MSYAIKEIFLTLQGEGGQIGRTAVFCRFTGCNLWSGQEADRASAVCQFCDTDFVGMDGEGGGRFIDAQMLANAIEQCWGQRDQKQRFVVFTGGEPLLQLDEQLIQALKQKDFYIAVETNGTLPVPKGVDWICVSPKAGAELVQTYGDELKLIYPQEGLVPQDFIKFAFTTFRLQPKDDHNKKEHLQKAIEFCQNNPIWHLSLQTHKLIGIP
ncbi:7-carboxy-7-deazaguanine synthase [Commensalibacter communis]|uniref:7-carboxy-7-deazaguanine synthase n=1 Tax=Commensalibacter communis TaxID=2972786 RepID=UPI0022FF7731|nr:7-carboxy-7-deazaguanine synthase [Commensalibacter communis]CAI3937411.1 Organic radical activating enzyme NrdG/QueE (QueE) (PUBMED:14660578 [Commensalibacter communis]CAI3940821.1 Organic radical activating enzyme NrdG/QueE (QueE) (PUBMED:14660578 [Commensalibacter communis]